MLGGIFSLIMEHRTGFTLPQCLMGCLEGVPDVFGMDVEHEAGVPSWLFIPSQPQKLALLVFELPGWPQRPFINQEDRFWQGFGGPDTARSCLNFCGSKLGSWGKNYGIPTPECP